MRASHHSCRKMNGWSTQSAPTIHSFTQCLFLEIRTQFLASQLQTKMNGWSTQSAPTIRSFTQCLLSSGRNRELWILSNGALQIWPPFSAFCKTAKLLVLSAFENAILSTQSAPTILSFTQSRLWHLPSLMCELWHLPSLMCENCES